MNLALADKAHSEETISITCGSEIVKIRCEHIIYTEAQRNCQYIYLADGSVEKAYMTGTKV